MTRQPKEKPVVTLDSPSVTVIIDGKRYSVSISLQPIRIPSELKDKDKIRTVRLSGILFIPKGVRVINSEGNWLLVK